MRSLLMFSGLVSLLFSCSKDVRSTNKVNGSWRIEVISGTHHTTDVDGTIYFNKCDILDNDFRMMREDYSYFIGDSLVTVKNSGAYKFTNDGKTLILRTRSENITEYTVQLHKKDKLVFSGASNGIQHVYTLRKV